MQRLRGQSAGKAYVVVTTMTNKHEIKDKSFQNAVQFFKNLKGEQKHWFVAGFVDGEGSFNVSFAHQPARPSGFLINPRFQVYQHKDHEDVLWMIRDVFGTGRIDKKWGTDVRVFTIENRRTLTEKVIPFFRRHRLMTKSSALCLFEEIIKRMNAGEHLTREGFIHIVHIAYDMNQHGKARKIEKSQLIQEVLNNFKKQHKNPQRPEAEL